MKNILKVVCGALFLVACNSGSPTEVKGSDNSAVVSNPVVVPAVTSPDFSQKYSSFTTEISKKAPMKSKAAKKKSDAAPWDSLPPEQKTIFVDDLTCAQATAAAHTMLSWTASEPEATTLFDKEGYTQATITSPDGEMQALLFRGPGSDASTPLIIALPPVFLFVDYYMAYETFVNEVEPGTVLAKGTGEFFCNVPVPTE